MNFSKSCKICVFFWCFGMWIVAFGYGVFEWVLVALFRVLRVKFGFFVKNWRFFAKNGLKMRKSGGFLRVWWCF